MEDRFIQDSAGQWCVVQNIVVNRTPEFWSNWWVGDVVQCIGIAAVIITFIVIISEVIDWITRVNKIVKAVENEVAYDE